MIFYGSSSGSTFDDKKKHSSVLLSVNIVDDIEEELDMDFAEIGGERMAEAGAGWPAGVASELKRLYTGLCKSTKRKLIKLPEVQRSIQELLLQGPASDVQAASAPVLAGVAAPPEPTPLSLQVRGMRRDHAAEDESVQRNVSEAFDSCVRRLGDLYKSADAPTDFQERIDFWHAKCGMSKELHSHMHKLRIWRNASLHHDQPRWARDGPRSAEDASRHIAEIERLLELEKR